MSKELPKKKLPLEIFKEQQELEKSQAKERRRMEDEMNAMIRQKREDEQSLTIIPKEYNSNTDLDDEETELFNSLRKKLREIKKFVDETAINEETIDMITRLIEKMPKLTKAYKDAKDIMESKERQSDTRGDLKLSLLESGELDDEE